jgi:hypothetical protein
VVKPLSGVMLESLVQRIAQHAGRIGQGIS